MMSHGFTKYLPLAAPCSSAVSVKSIRPVPDSMWFGAIMIRSRYRSSSGGTWPCVTWQQYRHFLTDQCEGICPSHSTPESLYSGYSSSRRKLAPPGSCPTLAITQPPSRVALRTGSGACAGDPATLRQHAPRESDLARGELLLAFSPRVHALDEILFAERMIAGDDPVDGGEKFQTERRLEALDEMGDLLAAGPGLRVRLERSPGAGNRTGHDLQDLVGVAAIPVARNVVALDDPQHVPEILRIGTVECCDVAQPE